MVVGQPGEVFRGGMDGEQSDELMDQLRGLRSRDAGTKQLSPLRLREQLDEASRGSLEERLPVIGKGLARHQDGSAGLVRRCLGQSEAGHFGLGEDDLHREPVVHPPKRPAFPQGQARGVFPGHFALEHGDMNDLFDSGEVARGKEVRHACPHLEVDHGSPPVEVEPGGGEMQSFPGGSPSRRQEDLLGDQLADRSVLDETEPLSLPAPACGNQRSVREQLDALIPKRFF